jgi:hypothetical protein
MVQPPHFALQGAFSRFRAPVLGAGLLAALTVTSCQSDRTLANPQADFDPRLEGAMEQLRQAIQAGEDEMASYILSNLRALEPDEVTLEALQRYQDVLDGRAVCRTLDVRLLLRGDEARAGNLELVAQVRNTGDQRVILQVPSVELTRTSRALNERGQLLSGASRRFSDGLSDLAVEAGTTQLAVLLSYPVNMTGEILAQDERWTATGRTPFLEVDGRPLPAKAIEYVPADKSLLAAFLPASAVEAAAASEFLAREGVFEREDGSFLPPLLERVVRLQPEDRKAAFEALANQAPSWNDDELARVVPALRWLTDADVPDSRPEAWRRLLAEGWPETSDPDRDGPLGSGRLILPGAGDGPN